MQINPDLQTSLAGPSNCLVKVVLGSLDVRIARILLKSPISNWYPNGIEAGPSNLLEVA